MLGVLALAGCSEEQSTDLLSYATISEVPPSGESETPTQQPRPDIGPPSLERTELATRLAKLSRSDKALYHHYTHAKGQERLGKGTWILAAPMTVDEARMRLLGPTPQPVTDADPATMNGETSAYYFLQIGDGVIAWESVGFSDPPGRLLAELSREGAVSAVVTQNDLGITRFGYARDGAVIVDGFDYVFIGDAIRMPAEVRDLAALAWDDVDGPDDERADWFDVAMAMSEKVTGVRATRAVKEVIDGYVVPMPWGAAEDG